MSSEGKANLHLEIAHVLFMDVVGYSKLLVDDQAETLQLLNQIVRGTGEFRAAEEKGELIRLPTGDGMALVFLSNPEDPVQCALEISKGLKAYPQLQLRMGIHSGPVNKVSDVNDRANVTGAGINMAQRVMDCGDAGHILLSKRAAADLAQYRHWQPCLHDVGELEVKHGTLVHVFNLYTDEAGNPQLPQRFTREVENKKAIPVAAAPRPRPALARWAAIVALLLLLAGAGFWLLRHMSSIVTSNRTPSSPPIAPSAPVIPQKSIAVLPFENLSSEKENAYFAEGIQEEILTRLAKIADLKVISRTSTQRFKSAPDNLPVIAKTLGVTNILEGSVQKSANQIRVNVQLINAMTDAHLWADIYDRRLTDVFQVESDIAKAIAETLRAKLTGSEQHAIASRPTEFAEAHQFYLKGRYYWNRRSEEGLKKAIDYFKQAIDADPNYALAYIGMADSYLLLGYHGYGAVRPTEAYPKAKVAAGKALQIDETLGEAHASLASVKDFYDWDPVGAEEELSERLS